MGDFDELVERLLSSVALSGTHGFSVTELEVVAKTFFDQKHTTASSNWSNPPGDDLLFSEAPPAQTSVDEALLESVYDWLVRHPDVEVRDAKETEAADLDTRRASGPTTTSMFQATHTGKRLFTSEERMWQAITGHGVDHKRIPPREFEILCVIAAHGSDGVLQPSVTKLTGQDKRSVPKRTDMLAEKGYIMKSYVSGFGTRTSFLKLKRYEAEQAIHTTHHLQNEHRGKVVNRPVIHYDAWYDMTMRLLKENNAMLALNDLRIHLGIDGCSTEVKLLRRCIRRLTESGCVRRLTARYQDSEGRDLTVRGSQNLRIVQTIQLLREPTEVDRVKFRQTDSRDKEDWGQGEDEVDDENDLYSEDDAAASGDEGQLLAIDDGEPNDLDLPQARVPPSWEPTTLITNQIYNIVDRAGQEGVAATQLGARLAGPLFRRPLDEATARLTDVWQHSQPRHLRYLTIKCDTEVQRKMSLHRYRTISNFAKAVASGTADPKDKDYQRTLLDVTSAPDLDTWGFPKIPQKDIFIHNGTTMLARCQNRSQPTAGDSQIQKSPRTNAQSSSSMSKHNFILDGEFPSNRYQSSLAGSLPSTSKAQYSTRRFTGHEGPQSRLQNSEPLTGTNETIQNTRRPYRMKLLSERPAVPISRKHEIPEEEYETYEKAAQAAAERIVMFEDHARKKRTATDARLDNPSGITRKKPCLTSEHDSTNAKSSQDRITQVKADLISRKKPGVYVNPPGARSLKLENFVSRGRPRRALIAVFKSPRLIDFPWYQEDAPRFAPVSTASRNQFLEPHGDSLLRVSQDRQDFPHAEDSAINRIDSTFAGSPSSLAGPVRSLISMTAHSSEKHNLASQILSRDCAASGPSSVSSRAGGSRQLRANGDVYEPVGAHQLMEDTLSSNSHTRLAARAADLISASLSDRAPTSELRTSGAQDPVHTPGIGEMGTAQAASLSLQLEKLRSQRGRKSEATKKIIADLEMQVEDLTRPGNVNTPDVSNLMNIITQTSQDKSNNRSTGRTIVPGASVEPFDKSSVLEIPEANETAKVNQAHDFDDVPYQASYDKNIQNARSTDDQIASQNAASPTLAIDDVSPEHIRYGNGSLEISTSSLDIYHNDQIILHNNNTSPQQITTETNEQNTLEADPLIQCQSIILHAVASSSGVFPGNTEPWHIVAETSSRKDERTPDRQMIDHVIKHMIRTKLLRRFILQFKSKKGIEIRRVILADPSIDPSADVVKNLQKKIIEAFPAPYFPTEADVSTQTRETITITRRFSIAEERGLTARTRGELDVDNGISVVHQTAAVANLEDSKARQLGFTDRHAWYQSLDSQVLERKKKSLQKPAKTQSGQHKRPFNHDTDDEEIEIVSPRQAAMQGAIQISNYRHDLSAAQQPLQGRTRISKRIRLDDIASQSRFLFTSRAVGAHATRMARPMSAVRWFQAQRRDRGIEPGMTLDDIARHRRLAASMLMHPDQDIHEPTGTFGTSGMAQADGFAENWTSGSQFLMSPFDNYGFMPEAMGYSQNRLQDTGAEGAQQSTGTNAESMSQPISVPKYTYKSRAKQTLEPADEIPETSESALLPGQSTPRGAKAHDIATVAERRAITGRDRKGPAMFKDADRLIIAMALISAVCGGINQDRLSWTLIAHTLSFRYEPDFLRRRWPTLRRQRKNDVERLRNALREPFLAAYERDELPTIDFSNLNGTDWPALFDWADHTVANLKKQQEGPELPVLSNTRAITEQNYEVFGEGQVFELVRDDYFSCPTDMNRKHLAFRYHYGSAFPGQIKPTDDFTDDLLLAKSWVRAVSMTRLENYNAHAAASKVGKLGTEVLANTTAEMLRTKMFLQEKKNRQMPGRNYDIHHEVLAPFKRWPARPHEHQYLRAVARTWLKIDEHFRIHGEMTLVPAEGDPTYLVLTNLVAQGMLAVRSVLPEVSHDFDAPYPRLSPWGYGPPGYETKKVDAGVLKFPIVYAKTVTYRSNHNLKPGVPIPKQPGMVPGEIGRRIPFWVDIHGNLIDDVWDMVLRSMLHLIVFRPGCTAGYIEKTHNHRFWAWEIEMVLEWMGEVGIAVHCGGGLEIGGIWKGGWRAGEWWYCAFGSDIATWKAPSDTDVGGFRKAEG